MVVGDASVAGDALVEPVRKTFDRTLLGAAGCVLLIGVANLANLLLAFVFSRAATNLRCAPHWAPRGRRPLSELLAEAALIGVAAAAIGSRYWRSSPAFASSARSRRQRFRGSRKSVSTDQVLAFCALASMAAVFLFGALPAWQLLRGRPGDATRDGVSAGRSPRTRATGLQGGLVVLQVAVAFVLLAGAGLFVETFVHFQRTELGWLQSRERPHRTDVSLPDKRYATSGFGHGIRFERPRTPCCGARRP